MENLKLQEEKLRFDNFTNEEALKFGNFMVEKAKKDGILIAVSIRLGNGCILFQHCPTGTGLIHQKWMKRKFNTVMTMSKSSLLMKVIGETYNEDVKLHGLTNEEYIFCGGGFPIRNKQSDIVLGVILASNLPDVEDHAFIVDCLSEYLNISL
ncbi:MAG: hypothetical protein BEN19_03880 [Epulopiscium sp. Nuni2H_MBin003]|nr:MAG: hypothetical protein BEN19_03880 [Epulopiscium sp. Nuni2H_MBin003]